MASYYYRVASMMLIKGMPMFFSATTKWVNGKVLERLNCGGGYYHLDGGALFCRAWFFCDAYLNSLTFI